MTKMIVDAIKDCLEGARRIKNRVLGELVFYGLISVC
jgi:hypothetical protein